MAALVLLLFFDVYAETLAVEEGSYCVYREFEDRISVYRQEVKDRIELAWKVVCISDAKQRKKHPSV